MLREYVLGLLLRVTTQGMTQPIKRLLQDKQCVDKKSQSIGYS